MFLLFNFWFGSVLWRVGCRRCLRPRPAPWLCVWDTRHLIRRVAWISSILILCARLCVIRFLCKYISYLGERRPFCGSFSLIFRRSDILIMGFSLHIHYVFIRESLVALMGVFLDGIGWRPVFLWLFAEWKTPAIMFQCDLTDGLRSATLHTH